jgi:hypothetical protein
MATFYLDLVGGNDANDGTTFANRWLTFTSGATAARIAPGDTIRIKQTPSPTLVGNATWNQNSKTVTLASAVTANIDDGELAWTASANVTSTADTAIFKEGTKSAKHVIAAGFTTGLASYKSFTATDFSAYQQVSFWIRTSVTIAASVLSIRLCSDSAGATTVNTILIPAITVNRLTPVTIDNAAALGSSIQSVALYAESDPGALDVYLDNIIACKASSAADSLTLTSLIGKVHNLSWVASTTYAANDIRRPTQPNRNGYKYKVTAGGGGAAGASEPTWPTEIGKTVVDGALTWTCEGLEDTWYSPQSINGTAIKIDNGMGTLGNAGRGYHGDTETISTYKRETAFISAPGTTNVIQDSGTIAGGQITFTGGWNSTDMSTQIDETWMDARNGVGTMLTVSSARSNLTITNINSCRGDIGINIIGRHTNLRHVHCNHHATANIILDMPGETDCLNVIGNNCVGGNFSLTCDGSPMLRAVSACNSIAQGMNVNTNSMKLMVYDMVGKNNGTYAVLGTAFSKCNISGLVTGGNGSGSISSIVFDGMTLNNSLLGDTVEFATITDYFDIYNYSQKHDQTANNHFIATDGGSIISATDQRNTPSGISWKFRPTSTTRSSMHPLKLPVAKIAIAANTATTIKIYARRDSTDIKGQLFIAGGQAAGIPDDVTAAMEPSINTWQQFQVTVTPTENAVIEVLVKAWDGVGTTNAFWVDDLSVI